jgi:cysteine synthase
MGSLSAGDVAVQRIEGRVWQGARMTTTHPRQDRDWVHEAIRIVEADSNRSADTHLLVFPLPPEWGTDLYLKDESVHPTGSLKHRLARSLFLFGLCNGTIRPGTTIIEASSGSTAVSEAYFARMLGLPFVAVMPRTTSQQKIDLIEFRGGECHLVDDPSSIYDEARRLAEATGGYYLDQFTYAERVTDWRGNNNIAESIFEQMSRERHPVPTWVVLGAGTGGTSATIGRYARYKRYDTSVCVVDPEGSVYLDSWSSGSSSASSSSAGTSRTGPACASRIEGIGRPRVEPSFVGSVVDAMIRVPDAASVAAMRWTSRLLGRSVGGSTGTAMWGALALIARMRAAGETGSVVTVLSDDGDRYRATYGSDEWVAGQSMDLAPFTACLDEFLATGEWRGRTEVVLE